ncbi:MAG: hypothetical protein WCL07_01015 [bacterium]
MKLLSIERAACSVALLLAGCKAQEPTSAIATNTNTIALRTFVPDNILIAADLVGVPIADQPILYGDQEFVNKECEQDIAPYSLVQLGGCITPDDDRIVMKYDSDPLIAVHEAFHTMLSNRSGSWKIENEKLMLKVNDGNMELVGFNPDGTEVNVDVDFFNEWWVRVTDYTLAAKILTDRGGVFDEKSWDKKLFDHGLDPRLVDKDWRTIIELSQGDKDIMSNSSILTTIQIAFNLAQQNSVIGENANFFGDHTDSKKDNVDVEKLYKQVRDEFSKVDPTTESMSMLEYLQYLKDFTTMNGYGR